MKKGILFLVVTAAVVGTFVMYKQNANLSLSAKVDLIQPDKLKNNIPPPFQEAVLVTPRQPLRNGKEVTQKKRWVWVPDNKQISVIESGGKKYINVPVGTVVWKEFYVDNGLIERRLIRKGSGNSATNGWEFYAAHKTNTGIQIPGFGGDTNNFGTQYRTANNFRGYHNNPSKNVKTAHLDADMHLTVGKSKYIFPGQNACKGCHAGATNAYPGSVTGNAVWAFSLHPKYITPESLDGIKAKGWITDEAASLLFSGFKDDGDVNHRKFMGYLRNNCLSCHTNTSKALARHSSFQLDPKVDYSRAQLRNILARQVSRAGIPLFDTNNPSNSELWRFVNADGRTQMPPMEGGLSQPDSELIAQFKAWLGI